MRVALSGQAPCSSALDQSAAGARGAGDLGEAVGGEEGLSVGGEQEDLLDAGAARLGEHQSEKRAAVTTTAEGGVDDERAQQPGGAVLLGAGEPSKAAVQGVQNPEAREVLLQAGERQPGRAEQGARRFEVLRAGRSGRREGAGRRRDLLGSHRRLGLAVGRCGDGSRRHLFARPGHRRPALVTGRRRPARDGSLRRLRLVAPGRGAGR
jgi:hypothetical protein